MDDELKRTGYNDIWTRIEIDGMSYYVKSSTVTTEKPIKDFDECDETVYFINSAYAYTKPSHLEGYSERIHTFKKGDSAKRTGIAKSLYVDKEGKEYKFARIEYVETVDGVETTQVWYVNNEYLSTEAPADPDAGITFEECSDILVVVAEKSFALRKSALWVKGDDEFNADQIAISVQTGVILQATHKGVESDRTVWYKVIYEDVTYYAIYNTKYLKIQTPAAE
jgi:hypothetical protein